MRLTAFFKLYKICILLHRCNLKILAKNRFEKISNFCENSATFCKCRQICKILPNFKNFSLRILQILKNAEKRVFSCKSRSRYSRKRAAFCRKFDKISWRGVTRHPGKAPPSDGRRHNGRSAKFRQNVARFRLYRHRFLQLNMRLSAFFKIYQIFKLKFLKFGKILQILRHLRNVCWIFTKIAVFSNRFFAKILRLQRCKRQSWCGWIASFPGHCVSCPEDACPKRFSWFSIGFQRCISFLLDSEGA